MKRYNYTITVEYVGTVELDPEIDGPFADDDDEKDYVEDLVVDEYHSYGRATVVDVALTEIER